MRVGLRQALLGMLGLLAVVLALEWAWPAGQVGTPAQLRREAALATSPVPAPRETSVWASAALARPLFSISRRPPRAEPGGHGTAAPGQARLAGIMITGFGRRAIFAPEGGGKQMVLAEGAAVNDSTIRAIQPGSVVLASGAVLRPAYDRNRVLSPSPLLGGFVPSFPSPAFPNPGFATPAVPGPTFAPGVPNPLFGTPAMPPASGEQGQPTPPVPPQLLRGNLLPQRRE